jgi:[protein-PII] uridylyltransferase
LLADGSQVTVIAPDRPGLLATVAGVLTLSGALVRSARTVSDTSTGMALLRFEVAPAFDTLPDWEEVRTELGDALDDRLALASMLEERERQYAWRRRASAPALPEIRVTLDNRASANSSVIEVRAPDRGPVLYQVTQALTDSGVTISRALVNTLGAEAIDVFYVQTTDGRQVLELGDQERLVASVTAAL